MGNQPYQPLHNIPALTKVAQQVCWYESPQEVLNDQRRFLNMVMARATFENLLIVNKYFSQDALRDAFLNAPPGLYDKPSWAYWGLMLLNDQSSPLPVRFAENSDFDWRHKSM